jgi:hypothetical protein
MPFRTNNTTPSTITTMPATQRTRDHNRRLFMEPFPGRDHYSRAYTASGPPKESTMTSTSPNKLIVRPRRYANTKRICQTYLS